MDFIPGTWTEVFILGSGALALLLTGIVRFVLKQLNQIPELQQIVKEELDQERELRQLAQQELQQEREARETQKAADNQRIDDLQKKINENDRRYTKELNSLHVDKTKMQATITKQGLCIESLETRLNSAETAAKKYREKFEALAKESSQQDSIITDLNLRLAVAMAEKKVLQTVLDRPQNFYIQPMSDVLTENNTDNKDEERTAHVEQINGVVDHS